MLFNEPKLLKSKFEQRLFRPHSGFSALQRAEIAEIRQLEKRYRRTALVSVLFNEPKLLKHFERAGGADRCAHVSVLFNEPKLLKFCRVGAQHQRAAPFQCSSTSRNC